MVSLNKGWIVTDEQARPNFTIMINCEIWSFFIGLKTKRGKLV